MNSKVSFDLDLDQLSKAILAKVAVAIGERGDWARIAKEDIIARITSHDFDEQCNALRTVGATDDDIENMRIGDPQENLEPALPTAKEAIEVMINSQSIIDEPKPAKPEPAKPVKPTKAVKTVAAENPVDNNQVTQIATLLTQVLATNKTAIDADQVAAIAGRTIDAAMQDLLTTVDKKLAGMPPRQLSVTSATGMHKIDGRQHMQFELLLKILGSTNGQGNSNLNLWLTGMPGTGKTHATAMAAKALGAKFFTNGSIANKYELTGFVDAHGKLVRTPFRDAWELGGVYLFDEVDGSNPMAVLAFNAALANGVMAFPDGMILRHKNCIVVAAANTSGQGATAELVGRAKQDAAFLDRFVELAWLIDEELETHLCHDKEWSRYVQSIRRRIATKGIKTIVSPRASLYGDQLLCAGIDRATVTKMVLRKGMSEAQWDMIRN